jgi:hypothetical protein
MKFLVFTQLEHYMKGGGSPDTSSKYIPISPSVTDSVMAGIPDNNNVVQQVAYLKNKLEEEHSNYKRKLQAYQDGQQRQAQLIQKLQQKVCLAHLYCI